ncbi:MAG: hypothetical protein LBK47_02440 [Prevotellaceae bacterium]|jgi:hypothetical protein|nr:hypothetical protein [Prevotellaceae bacterium]
MSVLQDMDTISKNHSQPLAEVFGFPIENESERALRYRQNRLCPYSNSVSSCTKNSVESPLGVCSLQHKNRPVIICPVRFREDWRIMSDAANFIFNGKAAWTHVGEVALKDKSGKTAGNIDYVLISYDSRGRVLDFGSLEVQAVYISGNLTGPFGAYMEHPTPDFSWTQALKYPKPDYLSSSRKRLIPQIIAKGYILKQWNKKQAVALQTSFYETLPPLPEISKSDADFAFFLYDLYPCQNEKRMELALQRVVYTEFEIAASLLGNNIDIPSISDYSINTFITQITENS